MIPRGKKGKRDSLDREERDSWEDILYTYMKCHERNEVLGQDVYDRSLKQSNILPKTFYQNAVFLT